MISRHQTAVKSTDWSISTCSQNYYHQHNDHGFNDVCHHSTN